MKELGKKRAKVNPKWAEEGMNEQELMNLKQRVTQTDGVEPWFFESIDGIEKYLGGLTREITNIRHERECHITVSTDSNSVINK